MSWLLALLVLALVAFFIVKFMKSSTLKQQQEHQHLQKARLDATTDAHAHQSSEPETPSSSTNSVQNAGAAAVAGVGAVAAAQSTSSAPASSSEPASLQTGNSMSDVREMIKILNLDGADSRRLDISSEELTALRKGDAAGIPDNAKLEDVAMRLRKMLA